MNFVGGWNQFISIIPAGVQAVLAVIGVALIVWFVLVWVFKSVRGGGFSIKTFPWGAVVAGAILAGPMVTIPLILLIVQTIVTIAIAILTWLAGMLSG
jgi:hypothetical protein